MSTTNEFEVVVIGAGPAGVIAAARAAELGARTALVTDGSIGGMAADDGPVPVRTLAQAARLLRGARGLGSFGVDVSEPRLNYAKLLARVSETVTEVQSNSSLRHEIESNGGRIFEKAGHVSFIDEGRVHASDAVFTADKFVLCTGGVNKKLPIPGFELTSSHSDAWSLKEVPASMIVVGGGATGLQVASVFHEFGSAVRVFEAGPRILVNEDLSVASEVADAFRRSGIDVNEHFGTIKKFERSAAGMRMVFDDLDGKAQSVEAEIIVAAVGWGADTAGLDLPAAGVDVTERGFVQVDQYLRSSSSRVLAAGDVTGRVMLASEAIRDGYIAGTNAVRGTALAIAHRQVPAGSFTDPEYASVGLSEVKARDQFPNAVAVSVDYAESTRAIIDGQTEGFCKLVVDADTLNILGCHVVGERAVEIVQLVSVALGAGSVRVDAMAEFAVSFPTYAELLIHTAVKASHVLGAEIGWRPEARL